MKPFRLLLLSLLAIPLFVGCAQAPSHTYVVEYQVLGDRSVKYLYIPSEPSMAGQMFVDQSIGLEICSVADPQETPRTASEADSEQPPESLTLESRCRTSRILRTQEYR